MVERIGLKPSSYAPYKNIIAFHTSTPLFLRVQSPNFAEYCVFCLHYLRAVVCLGLKRNISVFFFSFSSASDSKELAMEITSLNSYILGESNYN